MELTTSLSLLEQLKTSDHGTRDPAWARFVFLYTPLLMHWARKQGFQESEAEDLIQEAFVRLMSSLQAFRKQPGSSFRGWLMTLLRHLGHDYRRRKATRKLPIETMEDRPGKDEFVDLEDSEYNQWIIRRGLSLIRDEFSDGTWKAFEGLVLQGKGAKELAHELGTSPNAIYLARHRVLARLREELSDFVEDQ